MEKHIYQTSPDNSFAYELNRPDEKYELPGELREISGLSYYKDFQLICVQDEEGIIYKFDLSENKILDAYKFEKDGDYEGIEIFENTAYVLKSDGTLIQVMDFENEEIEVQKIETKLTKKNDSEGLGYDPLTNSLLIACKGDPSCNDNNYRFSRAIYAFDLKEMKLSIFPVYLIDLDKVKDIMKYNKVSRFSIKILYFIYPSKGDVSFQPSGIAVHPLSGNIYILGSVGKSLLVVDPKGALLTINKLDPKIFLQPEGICFSQEGTMYISSEGVDGNGYILEFNLML
jgi:uncharacterized protein YjiK